MVMIKRSILLSLAVALGVLITPATNALLINVEDAYEVSARDVIMPSSNAGNLIVRPCAGCDRVVLLVTARSKAFIGSEEVTFKELNEAAGNRTNAWLVVFFTLDEKVVTRVVLSK